MVGGQPVPADLGSIIPATVRILEVTQMWPSPENPDLGSFLVPLTRELKALGHEVEVVSISKRGGSPAKYLRLSREARAAARRPYAERGRRASSTRGCPSPRTLAATVPARAPRGSSE